MLDEDLSAEPVAARLENSEKILWTSHEQDAEGYFEIEVTKGGMHRFCMQNGKHLKNDGLDRQIGYMLRVRNKKRSLEEDEEGPDSRRALQLIEWASDLQDEWETLLDHYGFLRTRETQHAEISYQIMGRVVRWTIFQGGTLALIAAGQILYLRKFMETRRYL
eukprot:CAMPEP_0202445938 /NCGR_PEP_ID=MMETSP1360-20130828/4634_1 /ASSEMBLY_ACC=CAM_ASM_000848 /TAXON_ID=515479 /ORGANISM="Licmophora paradoxa, Strain CCMP2313" /LENGTH=162 /DNA_ID=CAMNT_0049062347 /DNA_START=203 /DNA_END=691 /DNA_ORIENTATION=-